MMQSTDNSEEIILKNNDSRIRILLKPEGLIYMLNRGIDSSKGEYIEEIHADDVTYRIENREIMDTHPQTVALGSAVWNFDGIHKDKLYNLHQDPKRCNLRILLGSPIPYLLPSSERF